jgi:hypothetical protein
MARAADDLDLLESNVGSVQGVQDADMLAIKLHSKLLKAHNLLNNINISLVSSTLDEIIKYKPVFDAEKLVLLKLLGAVETSYKKQSGAVSKSIDVALNEETGFAEWNSLSVEINDIVSHLNRLNRAKAIASSMPSPSRNTKQEDLDDDSQAKLRRKPKLLKTMIIVLILFVVVGIAVAKTVSAIEEAKAELKREQNRIWAHETKELTSLKTQSPVADHTDLVSIEHNTKTSIPGLHLSKDAAQYRKYRDNRHKNGLKAGRKMASHDNRQAYGQYLNK